MNSPDKTVSGKEFLKELISSGKWDASTAKMELDEAVKAGYLALVEYDIYRRPDI